MRTDSLLVFSISTAVTTLVALFDHWLAHNPKTAANCTWQFNDRLLHGMSQSCPGRAERHYRAHHRRRCEGWGASDRTECRGRPRETDWF